MVSDLHANKWLILVIIILSTRVSHLKAPHEHLIVSGGQIEEIGILDATGIARFVT